MLCGNVLTVSSPTDRTINPNNNRNNDELFESGVMKSFSLPPRVSQDGPSPSVLEKATSDSHLNWLNKRKVGSFYRGVVAADLQSGVNVLLQVRGEILSFIVEMYQQNWAEGQSPPTMPVLPFCSD